MPTTAILNSHPLTVLKKEVSKTNIKGYSKMKKAELIVLMMTSQNRPRFHHIKMREGKAGEVVIKPVKKARPATERRRAEKAKQAKAGEVVIKTVKKKIQRPEKVKKAKPAADPPRWWLQTGVASIPKVIEGKVEMTFAGAEKKHDFEVLDYRMKKDYSKKLLSEVGTDYEKLPGFSAAKAKQYTKLESLFEDGLTGKQANQKERFDEMYFEGIRSLMEKRIKNAEIAFRKKHMTRKKRTLKEWIKIWDDFRDEFRK